MTQAELPFTAASQREAYANAVENADSRRSLILASIEMNGPSTADEIADRFGWPPYQCRPRLTELRDAGRIKAVGRRPGISGTKITIWSAVFTQGDPNDPSQTQD